MRIKRQKRVGGLERWFKRHKNTVELGTQIVKAIAALTDALVRLLAH